MKGGMVMTVFIKGKDAFSFAFKQFTDTVYRVAVYCNSHSGGCCCNCYCEKGKKKTMTYRIVGSTEADPFNGRISDESPVGKALVGHGKGDEVEVETPGGTIKLVVEDISK
jgi:hypothetical protein